MRLKSNRYPRLVRELNMSLNCVLKQSNTNHPVCDMTHPRTSEWLFYQQTMDLGGGRKIYKQQLLVVGALCTLNVLDMFDVQFD